MDVPFKNFCRREVRIPCIIEVYKLCFLQVCKCVASKIPPFCGIYFWLRIKLASFASNMPTRAHKKWLLDINSSSLNLIHALH